MKKFTSTATAIALCALISGCDLFDSGTEWRSGPYALLWIDKPGNVSLSYDLGSGSWAGRVEPQVFAVGANDHYIVVKQHPIQNKLGVDYYIVLRGEDSMSADPKKVVLGPLTTEQFNLESKRLNLPQFSKVLEALQ